MAFRHRFVNTRFGVDLHLFRLALDSTNSFFVAGWNKPFLILFMLWLVILRRSFLFAADTPNPNKPRSILKRIIRKAFSSMAFHGSRKVLAMGTPGREVFESMGCPPEKIVSFPYFTPITDYDSSWKKTSRDDPVIIVSVGQISNSLKGFDIGLEALGRLKQSEEHLPFRYLICGTGPDLEKLRKQKQLLGLSGNVEFLGWLETDEITNVLQRAHILLHPARWEPYGVAILEAMVNGVVVLGSEGTCAARDRILDGRNGFIHPVGNVDKITEQLAMLLKDRDLLLRMSMAARQTAEEWPASRGVEILRQAFLDHRECL
jgi:glycosyltransferase involved in cell wall biosynthesis